jgi:hypothetical protein
MDNIDHNISILLERINSIYKRYDEIAKATGENFNIFQTLELETDEGSHSKIIAELLNPKGSHGRGSEFLELFMEIVGEDSQKKLVYSFLNGNKNAGNKIINWLERCKEKAINFSYLRETIAQYIHLLKNLTGQSRRKDMSDEIVKTIVKNPESVASAFEIIENEEKIKREIALKHFLPAMKKLANEIGLTLEEKSEIDCLSSLWGIYLNYELLEKNNIRICFEFQEANLRKLGYGFCIFANEDCTKENKLKKYIMNLNPKKASEPHWIFYDALAPHANWHGEQLADLVKEESEVIKKCEEKIVELLDLLKDYNP